MAPTAYHCQVRRPSAQTPQLCLWAGESVLVTGDDEVVQAQSGSVIRGPAATTCVQDTYPGRQRTVAGS